MWSEIYQPTYYSRFSCIGGDCEDNCCNRNWRITVDHDTYERYQQIEQEPVRTLLRRHVVPTGAEGGSAYAVFRFGENGRCPFQTEDGWCLLHKNLGEGYLGMACRHYPRNYRSVKGGVLERSLAMTCPEAVRVGLLQPEPIAFETIRAELPEGVHPYTPHPTQEGRALYLYAWPLREAVIRLLQDQRQPLPRRLLGVVRLLHAVCELVETGRGDAVPGAIADFSLESEAPEYDAPPFTGADAGERWLTLQRALFAYAETRKSLRGCQDRLLQGYFESRGERATPDLWRAVLRMSPPAEQRALADVAVYLAACADARWEKILRERGQALENYLVNDVFAEVFPFRYQHMLNPLQHAAALVEKYALLRTWLCAVEDADDAWFMEVVKAISVNRPDTAYEQHVVRDYTDTGLDTTRNLVAFLGNHCETH